MMRSIPLPLVYLPTRRHRIYSHIPAFPIERLHQTPNYLTSHVDRRPLERKGPPLHHILPRTPVTRDRGFPLRLSCRSSTESALPRPWPGARFMGHGQSRSDAQGRTRGYSCATLRELRRYMEVLGVSTEPYSSLFYHPDLDHEGSEQ